MSDQADFDPKDEIASATDAVAALATAYASRGRDKEADELYRICADLELRSPGLQACWGGPLNGQTGRRRIMEDLIARYRPTCILETGTFRGLTTDWLAERFDGPILTCEASKRYFYQAERNLAKRAHVETHFSDSRKFLIGLDVGTPDMLRPLVYLDAHWEQDLPLREELQILLDKFESLVVVIDDFRVPGDGGYAWDDYGGGDALTVDYLATAGVEDCRLYFPTLPSGDETGARRGCCVLSRNIPCALEDGGLLEGGALGHWQTVQGGRDASDAASKAGPQPRHGSDVVDASGASYPDQIVRLHQHLQRVHNEMAVKEAVLQDLKRNCDERQRVIDDLVQALEAERAKA